MNTTLGFFHLFKTCLGNYLYDVNTHTILEISSRLYNYLERNESQGNDTEIFDSISVLKRFGFLKNNYVRQSKHPETDYIKYYIENHIDTISLQVTQNCNLRCDYCVYSGKYKNRTHNNIKMDKFTAKKGVDFLIERSRDCSVLFLGFYGGEPLLEYPLVKYCIDYAISRVPEKEIYFSLTTNATLLTNQIVDELVKYNIHILISLDGPRRIHNESRKFAFTETGSFDTIIKNLVYIKEKYPEFYKTHISFNMVLHEAGFKEVDDFIRTNPLLSDSALLANFITESYSKENIAYVDYELDTKLRYEYERFLLYASKVGILKNYTPSRLVLPGYYKMVEIAKHLGNRRELPSIFHRSGVCIPGIQKLFLTVKGDFYPCERVNECSHVTKIGSITQGLDFNKIVDLTNLESYSSEKCRKCWAYSFCEICLSGLEDDKGINLQELEKRCVHTLKRTDEILKDYSMLRHFGVNFDDIIKFSEDDIIDLRVGVTENEQMSKDVLYDISIPIVFITELCSGLIEDNYALNIKTELGNQGINAFLICDCPIEKNVDGNDYVSFHDFWRRIDISIEEKIYYLNHYVKEKEYDKNIDLIIVSIPGATQKFSNKFTDGFGMNFWIAQEALIADCGILHLPCRDYSKSDIENIINSLKLRRVPVDYVNIVPKKICIEESERNQKMCFLTLDDDIVDSIIHTAHHEGLFNLNHSSELIKLTKAIIGQLKGYVYKDFRKV